MQTTIVPFQKSRPAPESSMEESCPAVPLDAGRLKDSVRPVPVTPASELVEQFNVMHGRLRVSVTHACQLRCKFCHREGIAEHWTPTHQSLAFFRELAAAYASLGGRYLEITGGEPTLHPTISDLVATAAGLGCQVIICTNGLQLDRILPQLQKGQVHLIRLSLHYGDSQPESAREMLGPAWDFGQIERNLQFALAANVRVQLIFTHTRQNQDQLDAILRRALEWKVDVQIVDLITSRVGDPSDALGYVSGKAAEHIVSAYATLERVVKDRTGAVLRLYRTSRGAAWEIKDYHFGVLHSAMCDGCPLRSQCGEGIYALRVDALGFAKPCLLRQDLEFNIRSAWAPDRSMADMLHRTIAKMLAHPLEWSYDDVIPITSVSARRQNAG